MAGQIQNFDPTFLVVFCKFETSGWTQEQFHFVVVCHFANVKTQAIISTRGESRRHVGVEKWTRWCWDNIYIELDELAIKIALVAETTKEL